MCWFFYSIFIMWTLSISNYWQLRWMLLQFWVPLFSRIQKDETDCRGAQISYNLFAHLYTEEWRWIANFAAENFPAMNHKYVFLHLVTWRIWSKHCWILVHWQKGLIVLRSAFLLALCRRPPSKERKASASWCRENTKCFSKASTVIASPEDYVGILEMAWRIRERRAQ